MIKISWDDISVSDMDHLLIDHEGYVDGDARSVVLLEKLKYQTDDLVCNLSSKDKEK